MRWHVVLTHPFFDKYGYGIHLVQEYKLTDTLAEDMVFIVQN